MSLGFECAGFDTLAAIDNDSKSLHVLRANLRAVKHVLCEDLTKFKPSEFEDRTGIARVDAIIGGPPCQGFSVVRQRDGANNGARLVQDNRRTLYQVFLSYVEYFRPALFLMENVLGMRSAEGGLHYDNMVEFSHDIGYEIDSLVVQASKFGVPQSRRRLLFVGSRRDYSAATLQMISGIPDGDNSESVSLWEAIGDLPPLTAGEGQDPACFDDERREAHKKVYPNSKFNQKIKDNDILTAHVARPHNDRDLRDFARLREGETSKQALNRGAKMEFPYNRKVFTDKYTRLSKHRPSRSILAHMSKDGLMYIHPDQLRSLTPREAARLQTFPDSFRFPVARTHQYRMIGNAVPPLLSEYVAQRFMTLLNGSEARQNVVIH